MNIKYLGLFIFGLSPIFILAQTTNNDSFGFIKNGKSVGINITALQKGYWLAENQTDSIYLNILDTRCYYNEKDTLPYKAKMSARITYVNSNKPQKILSDEFIEIQFEYLDTLPVPQYDIGSYENDEKTQPKIFVFKRLLTDKLIIQEKDSLKRILVFNKLPSENPLFQQIKIDKLKEIEKKFSGLWSNKENTQFIMLGKAYLDVSPYLKYPPQLDLSVISFLQITKDSVSTENTYTKVEWSDNSEYIWSNASEKKAYKIDKLDDNNIDLAVDSLHIHAEFSKLPPQFFPDSILRNLEYKVWCDTIFITDEQKIDTFLFDFGDKLSTCGYQNNFLSCFGHLYDGGFHDMIFFEFFSFKNQHFFLQAVTHSSNRLWEILKISPDYLKIQKIEEEDVKIKELFVHPKNAEYFNKQQRIKY